MSQEAKSSRRKNGSRCFTFLQPWQQPPCKRHRLTLHGMEPWRNRRMSEAAPAAYMPFQTLIPGTSRSLLQRRSWERQVQSPNQDVLLSFPLKSTTHTWYLQGTWEKYVFLTENWVVTHENYRVCAWFRIRSRKLHQTSSNWTPAALNKAATRFQRSQGTINLKFWHRKVTAQILRPHARSDTCAAVANALKNCQAVKNLSTSMQKLRKKYSKLH